VPAAEEAAGFFIAATRDLQIPLSGQKDISSSCLKRSKRW
jgi:hypothetical protein